MKDKDRIKQIIKHYNEIQSELDLINKSFEKFSTNMVVNKAIRMDVFQIGENVNCLDKKVKDYLSEEDYRGIVDLRNFIGHGYVFIEDEIVWDSIHKDLPRLLENLKKYKESL